MTLTPPPAPPAAPHDGGAPTGPALAWAPPGPPSSGAPRVVAILAIALGALLLLGAIGGAVVTESVFAIPGLGRLTLDAILRRDYPVIQGVVLIFSFVYVLVNLAVDLIYTLVDPRIRY